MASTLTLAIAAFALGSLWLLGAGRSRPDVPPTADEGLNRSEPEPVQVDATEADVDETEIVRIVAKALPSAASATEKDKILASVVHRGELRGQDLQALHFQFEQIRDLREEELRNLRVDPSDSGALRTEAELLWELAMQRDAPEAVKNGDYVVSFNGDELPPLSLPESEVFQIIGHSKSGTPASVTIILPWAKYPHTAAARAYFDGMRQWDDSEKARKFNELPDAERHELARRISRIMRDPKSTQGERKFVFETIGGTTRLQPNSAIAIVPDQR